MWISVTLFYCYEFLLQVSPAVMSNELMLAFDMDATMLGSLAASFFVAYCGMQLCSGVLLDKFGPRRVLTAAVFICALGAYLFSQAQGLAGAMTGRFLIGLGAAYAAIGCLKVTTDWLPSHYFAVVAASVVSIGMLGAVGGQAPLAYGVDHYGWREILTTVAWAGFILTLVLWVVLKDRKDKLAQSTSMFAGIKEILSSKQNWILSIYAGLAFSPIAGFGGLWGVTFLSQAYLLSKAQAASMVSLMFVGVAVGCPIMGFVSNFLKRRKIVVSVGTLLAFFTLAHVVYFPDAATSTLSLRMFIFGFFLSAFFGSFTITHEVNNPNFSATALSMTNFLNTIIGAMSQPLIGMVLDWVWDGTKIEGVRQFTTADYQLALSLIVMFVGAAFLLSMKIRETHCRAVYKCSFANGNEIIKSSSAKGFALTA